MTQEMIEYIVWEVLWGTPLIITILAIGIYFTFKTGFFQFRFLKHAVEKALARKTSCGAAAAPRQRPGRF